MSNHCLIQPANGGNSVHRPKAAAVPSTACSFQHAWTESDSV